MRTHFGTVFVTAALAVGAAAGGAYSAAPLNIVSRFVLGVRPLEPGARKLLIAPDLCGMEFAEGTVPTAEGSVKVSATVSNLVVETPVPACVVWRGTAHEVAAGKHEFR